MNLTTEEVLLLTVLGMGTLIVVEFVGGLLNARAAYRNGVVDGFGYSLEPGCPGYAKAGAYLKKYMAHRWHELRA